MHKFQLLILILSLFKLTVQQQASDFVIRSNTSYTSSFISNNLLTTYWGFSLLECQNLCRNSQFCYSFIHYKESGKNKCLLLRLNSNIRKQQSGYSVVEKIIPKLPIPNLRINSNSTNTLVLTWSTSLDNTGFVSFSRYLLSYSTDGFNTSYPLIDNLFETVNFDCQNNDLDYLSATSTDECKKLCLANPLCPYVVFLDGFCYLKNSNFLNSDCYKFTKSLTYQAYMVKQSGKNYGNAWSNNYVFKNVLKGVKYTFRLRLYDEIRQVWTSSIQASF